jgi:hypothetical protein
MIEKGILDRSYESRSGKPCKLLITWGKASGIHCMPAGGNLRRIAMALPTRCITNLC